MSLTKQDIGEIKTVVNDVVENKIDKFAIVVARGFEEVQEKLKEHDKRFDAVDKHFDKNDSAHRSINARLDLIETDLSNIRNLQNEVRHIRDLLSVVTTRTEFSKLEARLIKVERHLGIAK